MGLIGLVFLAGGLSLLGGFALSLIVTGIIVFLLDLFHPGFFMRQLDFFRSE